MRQIVHRHRRRNRDDADGLALVEALYALGDINAEIHGLRALAQRPLDPVDDIGLVDDVIDALLDPAQACHAREVLREALSEIARRTLGDAPSPGAS